MEKPSPTLDPQAPTTLPNWERYQSVSMLVRGWFAPEAAATWDALLAHQKQLDVSGHLFEIGVWEGKSASLMAMHADLDREQLLLVDRCIGPEKLEVSLMMVGIENGDAVQFLQADSRDLHVHPVMTEGYRAFRWMHIDGEHTSGAVTSDLQVADRLLSREGVVCIDDFFNPTYPQVTEAVFRYLRDNPDSFSLFLCGYSKAYLARPHYVHHYLEFCGESLADELEARGMVTTISKTTHPAEQNTFGMGPRFEDYRYQGMDSDRGVIRY